MKQWYEVNFRYSGINLVKKFGRKKISPHILLVGNFPDWWDFFSPTRQNFGGQFNGIFIICSLSILIWNHCNILTPWICHGCQWVNLPCIFWQLLEPAVGLVTDGGPPADHRRMLSGLLLKRYVCGQHRQRQSAGPERGTATTHLSNVKLFSQSWIDRFKSGLPMTSCQ